VLPLPEVVTFAVGVPLESTTATTLLVVPAPLVAALRTHTDVDPFAMPAMALEVKPVVLVVTETS
jgi:hypothetical protein